MLCCNASRTFLLIASIVMGLIPCGSFADDQSLSPDAQALLESSRRAYANDKFDDAVKFAKKATQLEPDASVCQLWLGVAYSEKTQSGWFGSKLLNARRCRKAFERAVKLDSSSIDARDGLIEFHVRAPGIAGGNMETAWAQVEFIMQHDSLRAYLAAAYIYERKENDTVAAETALLSAVGIDSTSILAQLRLAGFYVRNGPGNKADSILVEAAGSGDRRAIMNLGWLQFSGGNAYDVFRSFLLKEPSDAVALFFLAHLHLSQGDFTSGDSLMRTLAEITGECSEIGYLRAIGESTTKMEPSEAVINGVKTFLESEPCIQYDPCWANPHLLQGVLSHRPLRAWVHYVLAGFYRRIQGKHKDFTKQAERALELDPTLRQARLSLAADRASSGD